MFIRWLFLCMILRELGKNIDILGKPEDIQMNWFWGLGIALSTLFLILLFSKITCTIHVCKYDQFDTISIRIRILFGLYTYKQEITFADFQSSLQHVSWSTKKQEQTKTPMNQEKTTDLDQTWIHITFEKLEHWKHSFEDILNRIQKYNHTFLTLLKIIHIDSFRWETMVGTNDAAETGVLTGIIWAMKSMVLAGVCHFFVMNDSPRLIVQPDFQQKTLRLQLDCIIHVSVGQAMFTACKLGILWMREGIMWRNIRLKG